jgi:hypothetical protein
MRRIYVWLIVAVVAIGSVVAGATAYVLTRPCTPPGAAVSPGAEICPVPPAPLPTTLIAEGTIFTVSAGQYEYFQFLPSPASYAVLIGSFTTTHGAAVYVLTPAVFANYSSSKATTFECPPTGNSCFTTGDVISGAVNISFLPIYMSPSYGVAVEPWFLVMQNTDASMDTNVTWTSSLVATYFDVYA